MTVFRAFSVGATLCAIAGISLVMSCSEPDEQGPVSPEQQATPQLATMSRVYTPLELHEKNPSDWVGAAHNVLLKEMARELHRPETRISDLCARMKVVVLRSDVRQRLGRQFVAADSAVMTDAIAGSPICQPRTPAFRTQMRRVSFSPLVDSTTLTATGELYIDSVVTLIEVAGSPTALAALLSPILDSTFNMLTADSAAVQATISVAQSSAEFWYDESEFLAIYGDVAAELDQCYTGNYEEQSYEFDGVTYICQGSEWRMAAWTERGPNRILFQNVALTRPVALCGPSGWLIVTADGIGLAIGVRVGISGGPGSAIVAAAIGGGLWSGAAAIYRAYKKYREC